MGTSSLSDAFSFAFMLPNLFRRLFAENSVSVAFIPTFRSFLDAKDIQKKDTQAFLSATLTLVSFLTVITVLLGTALAPFIVSVFSKSESADVVKETVLLTRIMFPYLFVISIAALLQGILNAHNVFSPSGFTPILFNIVVIGSAYLLSGFSGNPARAMAIGVMGGNSTSGFSAALCFTVRVEAVFYRFKKGIYQSRHQKSSPSHSTDYSWNGGVSAE